MTLFHEASVGLDKVLIPTQVNNCFLYSVTQNSNKLETGLQRALGPTSVQADRSSEAECLGPGVSSPQA